jgi:hypothetical protein
MLKEYKLIPILLTKDDFFGILLRIDNFQIMHKLKEPIKSNKYDFNEFSKIILPNISIYIFSKSPKNLIYMPSYINFMEIINYFKEMSIVKNEPINIWNNPHGNSYGDQKLIKEINQKLITSNDVTVPEN